MKHNPNRPIYFMLCTRELVKGPLYYASTITFCCTIYWRTSPIAIAAICNLCAGDGNGK
ncbi:putative phytol/farnesol kinase [Helianthus annuus]|nr:putative phytol/farnesol kinase [Helianthus annuus]